MNLKLCFSCSYCGKLRKIHKFFTIFFSLERPHSQVDHFYPKNHGSKILPFQRHRVTLIILHSKNKEKIKHTIHINADLKCIKIIVKISMKCFFFLENYEIKKKFFLLYTELKYMLLWWKRFSKYCSKLLILISFLIVWHHLS